MNPRHRKRSAFTLVEMSIVLVIIGLLVGGVLSGQSLIHAAELRGVVTYVNETRIAWTTFKDRYQSIPGDMPNATTFWGRSTNPNNDWHGYTVPPHGVINVNCPTQPGTPSATGTCNGDGDGYVASIPEPNLVWEHLALAGLISYPVNDQIAYTTAPPGLPKATIAGIGNNSSSPTFMSGYGTSMPEGVATQGIGLALSAYGDQYHDAIGGFIAPEDLWGMDVKMDDGLPDAGLSFGLTGTDGLTGVWYDGAPYSTPCAIPNGTGWAYNLTVSAKVCRALFALEKR